MQLASNTRKLRKQARNERNEHKKVGYATARAPKHHNARIAVSVKCCGVACVGVEMGGNLATQRVWCGVW